MEYKVLLLDSYDGFRLAAMRACKELKCDPTIIPAYDANPELVEKIKAFYQGDDYPDVIITRGAIATYLAPHFPNSVFSLASPDDIDFLYAIKKALAYGTRIGLIVRDEYEFEKKSDLYKKILCTAQITPYRYEKAEDVVSVLIAAKSDGMDVTVGGGTLAAKASARVGVPNIFVPTSDLSIKKALHNSLLYAQFKNEERRKNLYSSIATNHVQHGILMIEGTTIRFANTAMKEVLGVEPSSLINANFLDVLGKSGNELLDIHETQVFQIKARKFLVEREMNSPIDQIQTFTFQSLSTLQEKENAVRKSLRSTWKTRYRFEDIIADSGCMKHVIERAKLFAGSEATVLITGASGTGKEVLAQSIHHASKRASGPFVVVNCAAIPHELFESELFGYEEGSFTGARRGGKSGLFEVADSGTLFLDEINSLPVDLQGKLLRVIEEGEFRRVGSDKSIYMDIRLICASNEDIYRLVVEGRFRLDLFYRICTLRLDIPTLGERTEDILPLSRMLLQKYCEKYHRNMDGFFPDEEEVLLTHSYRGNVRELDNVLHRYVIESSYYPRAGLLKSCFDAPLTSRQANSTVGYITIKKGTLAAMERDIVEQYLRNTAESDHKIAEMLGISRSTLWRWKKDPSI